MTLAVFTFVCVAILIKLPSSSTQPAAGERISLSYAELIAKKKTLTEAQWKNYEAEITGKRVTWSGYVADVADDIAGRNYIWIDMSGKSDGDHSLYFEYPLDASLSLNRGQAITFEGDYAGSLLGIIHLENAQILR